MHRCWVSFTLKILFVIFCVLWTVPGANLECAGNESPLDILPKGDHVIEYESTLTLYCKLNQSHRDAQGFDARRLQFYKVEDEKKVVLPNQTVLNATTIRVDLVSPPLNSTYYYCELIGINVCLTNVVVGYKPQPVSDFQCASYNWERLYCHWTPPANPIKTQYRLFFKLNGRVVKPLPCPNDLDLKNNSCYYDDETDPPFRQPHQYYNFELLGENELGNISMSYYFHHFAHVIPNKPENVTIVSKEVGSAVIGWFVPLALWNFPPGLRVKIEYRNKWENWTEVEIPPNSKFEGKSSTFNITGLKYAHTAYDVRVHLKSSVAKVGPKDWSEPASVTFVTPSTIPSHPPNTTQGGFEVVSNGNDTDAYIYWARVSEESENGDHFAYDVVCRKDDGEDCGPPIEKGLSYAKFPVSSFHNYTFTVYSVNEVGHSVNSSSIVVKYGRLIQAQSFTKVAYDHGVFELSWKPVSLPELSNYTVFWCKEDKDLPVPCKGYLEWLTLPKNTTSTNVTMKDVTKFYKFAIAANLVDGTSGGMVWSSCVIFHDKVLKTVDDFHISRVGSREVDVVWEISCAKSSAFRGFAFYFCPVYPTSQDNKCKGNTSEELVKLNAAESRNATITHLKPYTTYKLQIAIISLDGSHQLQMGPRSISKRFRTLEDAPTAPLNLSAVSVSSTSVRLRWDLPRERNGVLESYKLNIERAGYAKEVLFNAQNSSSGEVIDEFESKDLISFTRYNFTLRACTSNEKCSGHSEPAMVTTLIGSPGKMMRPQISIFNGSMADVSWDVPASPGGPLDYYQLVIRVDGAQDDDEMHNLTGSRAKLAIKACQVKYNTPEFRIRAINVDANNVTHYGPWSETTEVHCGSSVRPENAKFINWMSGTFTVLAVVACLFCIIKKGWLQCRKMKDVEVKLPSGLQSQELEKESQDYVHLERWPPRSTETVIGSVGTVLAPDEESLLDKKSDESMDITSFNMPIKNGGDSSGCSVGRESVSSSITSDTHISSDSGAEPDQCMAKPPAFDLWNSSNPRTKTETKEEVPDYPSLPEWNLTEPPIPGYTKVGFGTCFGQDKNLPGKGYVTIASVASLNPSEKTKAVDGGNVGSSSEEARGNRLPGAKYVSLAHFERHTAGESGRGANGGRSTAREMPKLSRLDESAERDEEKTDLDSTEEEDFSGKETDTETIHEVPIACNSGPMPAYVSMGEKGGHGAVVGAEEEEEEDEDEGEEGNEDVGTGTSLSEPLGSSTKNVSVNGVESNEKMMKESESFSNYIPHHLFGRESVNT